MSRLIGRVWVNNKEFCISQTQHAKDGEPEYVIADQDKRAEFEAEKAKEKENK